MITGFVNSHREATVRVTIRGTSATQLEVEAVIDTGYDGTLTLPNHSIAALGLPFIGASFATLANGAVESYNSYAGIVEWDGQSYPIQIDEADTTPLIGMTLLYGYDLHIPVIDGGAVTISKLP